jgi:hypothetical protein
VFYELAGDFLGRGHASLAQRTIALGAGGADPLNGGHMLLLGCRHGSTGGAAIGHDLSELSRHWSGSRLRPWAKTAGEPAAKSAFVCGLARRELGFERCRAADDLLEPTLRLGIAGQVFLGGVECGNGFA